VLLGEFDRAEEIAFEMLQIKQIRSYKNVIGVWWILALSQEL
jgi:hypothetical protein